MSLQKVLHRLLVIISALTVLSGLTQMLFPSFVLRILSADTAPTAAHAFAIVGMFMLLFGGLLLQALLSGRPDPLAVFWAGLQKLGAAAAVSIGVAKALFAPLALLVAGFDLLSGVLIFVYWPLIRSRNDAMG
jgi:hypothetical protein